MKQESLVFASNTVWAQRRLLRLAGMDYVIIYLH